ncbi:hypothetical protein [Actinophytocola sediminis]
MLKAGEDPAVVTEEHGAGTEAVRAATRVLLNRRH